MHNLGVISLAALSFRCNAERRLNCIISLGTRAGYDEAWTLQPLRFTLLFGVYKFKRLFPAIFIYYAIKHIERKRDPKLRWLG